MASKVYMGPRGAERWVRATAPGVAFQPVGWSSMTQQRNGRASGRHSRVTHMEYSMSWNTISASDAAEFERMFYGVDGDGLIHWLDPMIENHLPAHWSAPYLGATDGEPLYGNARPTLVPTGANDKGLPAMSAIYFHDPATSIGALKYGYVPIPPGWQAHVGVNCGEAGSAMSGVYYRAIRRSGPPNPPQQLVGISRTVPDIYNTSITGTSGSAGVAGIEIFVLPPTGVNTRSIAGITVAVTPAGQPPTGSQFILGGGANGCIMPNPPTKTVLHAAPGREPRYSMALSLTEVGP